MDLKRIVEGLGRPGRAHPIEDIILVMGEAAIEAGVVRGVERVADEPPPWHTRAIQVFGERRDVPPQRTHPLDGQLVGPLAV